MDSVGLNLPRNLQPHELPVSAQELNLFQAVAKITTFLVQHFPLCLNLTPPQIAARRGGEGSQTSSSRRRVRLRLPPSLPPLITSSGHLSLIPSLSPPIYSLRPTHLKKSGSLFLFPSSTGSRTRPLNWGSKFAFKSSKVVLCSSLVQPMPFW